MKTTEIVLAKAVEATDKGLRIILADREVVVPWERCSEKLARASRQARSSAELSPGGYGVRWAELDEDLSIGGLVRLMET
ncbi:MAG: hypothetical protein BIFFINMI_03214 [Phycisphaerae bacterium]|nr:hypothetical protein [Phycisphaerae bacterium]